MKELSQIKGQDLVKNEEINDFEFVDVDPKLFIEDGNICLTAENGSGLIDYYGEFRGGYPWIDPRLEEYAEKNGYYWEWVNPGYIMLITN
jgi:hypothetical protein